MNETIAITVSELLNALNQSGGVIPLKVTLENTTNWGQFMGSALIALISSFGLLLILYGPKILSGLGIKSVILKKISRITGRNVVLIKHTEQGLFSQAMITEETLRKLTYVLNKFNGKDFDLILHTPGGEVFSSLAISRLLRNYPGKIRAFVPLYSMSGGSLLALSCDELCMTPNSCIGPIDPQLGNLFKYGSAKAWRHIVDYKGKKADDSSISFAMMGEQYTKLIKTHLENTIDFGLLPEQKAKLIQYLTDGDVAHAQPMTIRDLESFGIKVNVLQGEKIMKILNKLIGSDSKEGVHFYKIKEKK